MKLTASIWREKWLSNIIQFIIVEDVVQHIHQPLAQYQNPGTFFYFVISNVKFSGDNHESILAISLLILSKKWPVHQDFHQWVHKKDLDRALKQSLAQHRPVQQLLDDLKRQLSENWAKYLQLIHYCLFLIWLSSQK